MKLYYMFSILIITTITNCFASPTVIGANVLPPKYLSVQGFQGCLGIKSMGSWESYCLPAAQPNECSNESWSKLSAMNFESC